MREKGIFDGEVWYPLIDAIPASFWMSRGAGGGYEIVLWNSAATQIYGIEKSDALGSNFLELFVRPEARTAARADADRIISGDQSLTSFDADPGLAIDRSVSGEEVVLITRAFRVAIGGEAYQAEIAIDLSDFGVQELLDAEYRAQRAGPHHAEVKSVTYFLRHLASRNERHRVLWERTFAHEVRTSLVPVKQALEVLADRRPDIMQEPEMKDVAGGISATRQLTENSILLNRQPEVSSDGTFIFGPEIEEVLFELSVLAEQRELSIVMPPTANLSGIRLVGDPRGFRVIMRNIIGNAVRHWDDRCQPNGPREVRVSATTTEDALSLEIRNAGHLTASQAQHCFEPHFRDESQRFDTMHIGLSISKDFADAIGANLSLSNEGAVTVVTRLEWPRAQTVDEGVENE